MSEYKTELVDWVIYDDPDNRVLAEGTHQIRYRSKRGRSQALRLLSNRLEREAPKNRNPPKGDDFTDLWKWSVRREGL